MLFRGCFMRELSKSALIDGVFMKYFFLVYIKSCLPCCLPIFAAGSVSKRGSNAIVLGLGHPIELSISISL